MISLATDGAVVERGLPAQPEAELPLQFDQKPGRQLSPIGRGGCGSRGAWPGIIAVQLAAFPLQPKNVADREGFSVGEGGARDGGGGGALALPCCATGLGRTGAVGSCGRGGWRH